MTYGVHSFVRRVAPARVLRAYWNLKAQLIRWRRRQGQRFVSPLQASLTRVSRTSVIVSNTRQSASKVGLGLPPRTPSSVRCSPSTETITNASWTVSAGYSPGFAR